MSTVTTNHARSARRTRIVAEAVISAYIHDIAQAAPRPERTRRGRIESLGAVVHPAAAGRGERRPFPQPRRWDTHELAA